MVLEQLPSSLVHRRHHGIDTVLLLLMITDCVFNVLLLTVTNLNNLPDTASDKVRIAASYHS